MSDKRVSEMTDDQVRDLVDATGTWRPDAYYEARQAIMNDARAQGKELITRKAWPGAYSDITYAEPLEGIRIALTRASAARRAVDDYVKIAREEERTWAQVGEALGLAETAADRGGTVLEGDGAPAHGDGWYEATEATRNRRCGDGRGPDPDAGQRRHLIRR